MSPIKVTAFDCVVAVCLDKSYWRLCRDRNIPFRPPVVSRAVVKAACDFVRQSGIGFAWLFERDSGIGLGI